MPILAQIGHTLIIQAPMYVIKCWRPVVSAIANMLPQEDLHSFLAQKKTYSKSSQRSTALSRRDDGIAVNCVTLSKKIHWGN